MREWFTAAELEALKLPGLPSTRRGIALGADAQGWTLPEAEGRTWRSRAGRGGGVEFHMSALPLAAQAKLAVARAEPAEPRASAKAALSHDEAWAWFERLPQAKRDEAARRLATLDAVQQLVNHATPKVVAMQMVASAQKIALSTLYGWDGLVRYVPAEHRLPRLAPRHAGRTEARAECHPAAWDWLRTAWLRPEKPGFSDCYRQLLRVAAAQSPPWPVPAERTLYRRMMALPETTRVFLRGGADALKRMLPAQTRDHSVFHALQAVNLDDHRMDVFVRWPGVKDPIRPHLEAVQDIHSGMILGWRIDRSENTQAIRLAIGDVVEEFGIPEHFWFDNTRAAANKAITGGQANRFRFKVKDEDPAGLVEMLGAQVHFTRPYAGQSKPVERAFRDAAQGWAKDLRFSGAYTGNNPTAKPSNYGDKAVPLDSFITVIAERIEEHNTRTGRTSAVCAGRSFRQAFDESYAAAAERGLIRKASPAQRRLFLLQAEALMIRRDVPALHFAGNRYFADFMLQLGGQRVVARFDADALHAGVHVYSLDGRYIGEAECQEAAGFADTAAAREHARRTKAMLRAHKDLAALDRGMSLAQAAALLPRIEAAAPPPETKVVRPVFATAGATALKPRHEELEDELPAATRDLVVALQDFFPDRRRRPAEE